jgi:RimJ/RimL family protein N-acetyltransferase
VELRPYSEDDLALTEALETDPETMRELGGAVPANELPTAHAKRVSDPWYFVIVPAGSEDHVGQIGIWEREHEGERIHEVGWMLLPRFHGRGMARTALGLLLERARAAGTFESIHAFPGVTNAPSNALCRRFGFALQGEIDLEFRERPLRCNHWVLNLQGIGPGQLETGEAEPKPGERAEGGVLKQLSE